MTDSRILSEPFEKAGKLVNAIIETPRGCRNKFKYDERLGLFKLKSVLPAGAAFPYDFGFIPGTKADDGDPVDVLVLMDEPAFTGCLIHCRLIGVIVAEQTKDGKLVRNDRLIAVANSAETYRNLKSLRDVNEKLLDELVHFFVSYNETKNRRFEVLEIRGKNPARKLLEKSITSNGTNGRTKEGHKD